MKAVVMAGGEGSRLRPLTTSWPKPLLPVAGRSLFEHLLLLLRRHGITEAIATVQYLAPLVRTYLGDGSELGVHLSYVTETLPLGTAGSVKLAESALRDEPFLVLSGDALTDVDLSALVAFHHEREALVTMCLARRENPLGLGMVVTEDDGRVRTLLEKPDWGQVSTDTVNTGIYVVSPAVLAGIPADTEVDWSRDVFPALLADGERVFGFVADGYWEDVGTIEAYRQAQMDALDGRVALDIPGQEVAPGIWLGAGAEVSPEARIDGPAVLGDHARVEAGAHVGAYSVIGRNTIVGTNSTVERSVLMDNVFMGASSQARGCVVGRGTDVLERARIAEGSCVGESCRLEAEAVVSGGADVYPYKTIGAGEVVTDTVVWDSRTPRQMFATAVFTGVVNLDVTPEVAARVAGAFATIMPKAGEVLVARDHSVPAHAVSLVVAGALSAAGLHVHIGGTTPVPVARSFVARRCDGGVIVRTTPGRPDSLQLVFLDRDGVDLGARDRQNLERIINRHDSIRAAPDAVGRVDAAMSMVDDYVGAVIRATDLDGVAEAGLRIVVDTAGGPCASVLPSLMAHADVDVININTRITPYRPTESAEDRRDALRRLGLLVASSRAALGVRFDPGGERLSIVDETGRVLSDDRALLVVLDLIAAERRSGAVALPVTTTRVAEMVTSYHGVHVIWTPTGPQALAAATSADGLILAGDADGGFVIPAAGRSPDAMAALVQVLGLVARTKLTLRQIDTRIPQTTLLRDSVPTAWARKGVVMRAVREAAGERPLDETEGLRIMQPDGSWALIAPDPAEPAVRIWVEAHEQDRAEQLMIEWREVVERAAEGEPILTE